MRKFLKKLSSSEDKILRAYELGFECDTKLEHIYLDIFRAK